MSSVACWEWGNSVSASRLYSLYSPICCLRPLHLINAPGVIFDVALIHGPLPTINQHKLFLFTLTVIKMLSHNVTQAYFYRSNENWHQGKAGQVHQLKEVLFFIYLYIYLLTSLLSLPLSFFFSPLSLNGLVHIKCSVTVGD